jgi:membrane associated rhomboid family serine protease
MSFPRPYHGLNTATSPFPSTWNPFRKEPDPFWYSPGSNSDVLSDAFSSLENSGNGLTDLILQQYKKYSRLPAPIQVFFGLNVGAWILWTLFPRFMKRNALASVWNNRKGRWWSMFLATFSHRSLYHIAGNMSILLQYGPILIEELGEEVFTGTVLFSALVSGAMPVALDSFLAWRFPKVERFKVPTPSGDTPEGGTLGFSGVGMTLVYLFTVLYPETPVRFYSDMPTKEGSVTIRTLTVGTFALDCAGLIVSTLLFPTGISHSSHLAGFLCGSLVRRFLGYTESGRRLTSWTCRWKLRRPGPL